MTVIAYRDGIMAADSAQSDNSLYVGLTDKIICSPDGAIGACSGHAGVADRFRAWMESDRVDEFVPGVEPGNFGALVVTRSGAVHRMDHTGHVFPAARCDFYAEGYGREVALGAMAAGADAYEAAMVATRLVPYCLPPCTKKRVACLRLSD